MVDFSANINPLGMPAAVRNAARQAVEDCAAYPDPACHELTQALAVAEGVQPPRLICGNGAADLIFRVVWAKAPKRAVLVAPGFAEYEAALGAAGCAIEYELLLEQEGFALTPRFLERLTPGVDMAFLCLPNNPTGTVVDEALLHKIIRRCGQAGILLVLDCCFLAFLDAPPAIPKPLPPHVLLLNAFTKLYAMAGLRLGYGICTDPGLLAAMHRCTQAWSVSLPAQAAGVAALREKDYLEQTRALIGSQRAFLTEGLRQRGMQVYGSQANFIFFRSMMPDLAPRLAQQGILIRGCGNYHGLDQNYYRVAVRTGEENRLLLAAIDQILAAV